MEHIYKRTEQMIDVVLLVNGRITYDDKNAGDKKFFERCFEIAVIINKDEYELNEVIKIARTVAEHIVRRDLDADFTPPPFGVCEKLARECIE